MWRRDGRGLARLAAWCGVAVAVMMLLLVPAASADVASDEAAAILVFPKLVVDTSISPQTSRGRVDTLIRISNTSDLPISMRCFYVDATPQCTGGSGGCLPNPAGAITCTGICKPQWQETDFVVNITARQPVAWVVSQGASMCDEGGPVGLPCFPLSSSSRPGPRGQTNSGSKIPPVAEDPFIGELKCIAVDRNDVPVERNDLKGEAEIIRSTGAFVDAEAYNAIGIQAMPGTNNRDNTLVVGGTLCSDGTNAQKQCVLNKASDCPGGSCVSVGEYNGCPNVLVLDHFFDGAADPVTQQQVTTELTLVPCSEDFLTQVPLTTPVQFLVFNEFEQRFSTSRRITCFENLKISNIETKSANRSIFSAAVAGTLTGQTRIRGVADQDDSHGHALLGVAEEFRAGGGTAAFNLHFQGSRPQSDFIYVP